MNLGRVLAAAGAAVVAFSLSRCSGDDTNACTSENASPLGGDASCIDVTPTPLVVDVKPAEIWVHPNDAVQIAVSLARGPGGDGDVAVSIATDAGLASDALTIPAASTEGTLTLHIEPTFTQGQATLTVDAATSTTLAQTTLIVHVAGASGTLDTTFGSGGIADLSPSSGTDVARALIALQSGMLVGGTHIDDAGDGGTVSTMKVLRLTSGGGLDGTFAVTSAPGELGSIARAPSGNIFAVGTLRAAKADFTAVRILAVGGLDPKYAVTTALTLGDDVALAAAIEPGGNLVAAGSANNATAFGLARYTQSPPLPDASTDGAGDATADAPDEAAADATTDAGVIPTSVLDPTFGEGGIVVTPVGQTPAGARSLLVAQDGSLYALGFGGTVVALHYATSGALDTAFADGGFGTVPTLSSGAEAAILQGNGAIVLSGQGGTSALVARMLPSGALDSAFGTAGVATFTFATDARALAIDPSSSRIVVGGGVGPAVSQQCVVARLTSAGALDTTFANAGSLAIAQGDSCEVDAIAIDDDGKILVLETITASGKTHMAVARYWP